jgi:phi LC3 family holin
MDFKIRFKNPIFWITFIGLFLSSTRINPITLTSWILLKDALLSVLSNPYLIGCFVIAAIGQFNDPTTKGLSDKSEDIK